MVKFSDVSEVLTVCVFRMTELVKLDAEVIQGEYLSVMWDIWRDLFLHIALAAIRISYLPKMESVVFPKKKHLGLHS